MSRAHAVVGMICNSDRDGACSAEPIIAMTRVASVGIDLTDGVPSHEWRSFLLALASLDPGSAR